MALLRSHAGALLRVGELLEFHGTAGGLPLMLAVPSQAYSLGLAAR